MFYLGNENEYGGGCSEQDGSVIYTWSQRRRGATARGASPLFIPSVMLAGVAIGWALIRHLWLLASRLCLSQNSQSSGLCAAKSVKEMLVFEFCQRRHGDNS